MANNIVMVSSAIPQNACGAVVFWDLSGNVKINKLRGTWVAQGGDEKDLPDPPSALVALKRAMEATYTGRQWIVKPLSNESGYAALERESDENDKPVYRTKASAWLKDAAGSELKFSDGMDAGYMDTIEIRYVTERLYYTNIELGAWLVESVSRDMNGVPMRRDGRMYFVPRANMEVWRRLKNAMLTAAPLSKMHEIPALESAEASAALADAMAQEVATAARELEEEMKTWEDGKKPHAKTYADREARARQVEAKVASYEAIIGASLFTLRERMDKVAVAISRAAMMAE